MKLYHQLCAFFKHKRVTRNPIEKKLGAESLAKVMEEAKKLTNHQVNVREVGANEQATMPKAVDPSVEASLPKLEIRHC